MSTSLTEVIRSILDSMDDRRRLLSLDERTQNMLDRAIERVIDGTDQRIRAVPGYKRKLYKSILKALSHADSLIEQVPHPIELNSDHFVSDPYIRAFFPTKQGMVKVFRQSSELHEYFSDSRHARDSESCALLCMRKEEETVLGMELKDDHVIKDVKQIRVNFANHRIYSPAENESTARRELKCCIFEGLVDNALAQISELRKRRYQLEAEQQMLSSRLRSHKRAIDINQDSTGMVDLEKESRFEAMHLQQIEKELGEIDYVTPETCLDIVNTILSQPERFVGLRNLSIKIDKSGIKRPDDEVSRTVRDLHLSEVNIKGHPPRVVTLAKIYRKELEPAKGDSDPGL